MQCRVATLPSGKPFKALHLESDSEGARRVEVETCLLVVLALGLERGEAFLERSKLILERLVLDLDPFLPLFRLLEGLEQNDFILVLLVDDLAEQVIVGLQPGDLAPQLLLKTQLGRYEAGKGRTSTVAFRSTGSSSFLTSLSPLAVHDWR